MSDINDVFFSTAQAVAKGLDYLSSEERAKGLSKIPDNKSRGRLQLGYAMGTMFPFLTVACDVQLLLLISDNKALGRTGIIDVLKGQVQAEQKGLAARAAGFVGGGGG
jgi:hypothetical protein